MNAGPQTVIRAAGSHGTDGWIQTTVSRVEQLADEVVSLTLRPQFGETLPEWAPGAHIDVDLGAGLVRQYSLCGEPTDRTSWRITVLREPQGRGGSVRASAVRPGDQLPVRGPRNQFPLSPAPEYLFIAGGIGITPILPMVRAVARTGVPWRLYYGGRSRSSMAFTDELARYGDHVQLRPHDEFGLLDLNTILDSPDPEAMVYCCGPEGLLTAVTERVAHWPPGAVRMERFSPGDTGPTDDDVPFEVECRASGVTVTVAAGESILEAVERAGGVVVASSCREGTCGTCEITVLEGTPDHRDTVLTPGEQEAGDVLMTCVSRACTQRLVLDV